MKNIPKIILLVETAAKFGRELLRGIAEYAAEYGPWAFYLELGGIEKSPPKLKQIQASGIIVRDAKNVEEIIKLKIPTIFIAHSTKAPAAMPNVCTNNKEIGKMGAEHLLQHGFKHFAFCGFSGLHWSEERLQSFVKRILQAGFKAETYISKWDKLTRSWEKEITLIAEWLKTLNKPVAIMAANDIRGRHIIAAAKIANFYIPEQVSILGVDNDELICQLSDSPLSSIELNLEHAGYKAAELLDKLMKAEKVKERTIFIEPIEVITRHSTDILAIEDTEVAVALRFIQSHKRQLIQVQDVVDTTTLSRSGLYKRFRKITGRSIHDEIVRVRIEEVAKMLINTDMSLSQIAMKLGYPDAKHISRCFQQQMGITAKAYRKQREH